MGWPSDATEGSPSAAKSPKASSRPKEVTIP